MCKESFAQHSYEHTFTVPLLWNHNKINSNSIRLLKPNGSRENLSRVLNSILCRFFFYRSPFSRAIYTCTLVLCHEENIFFLYNFEFFKVDRKFIVLSRTVVKYDEPEVCVSFYTHRCTLSSLTEQTNWRWILETILNWQSIPHRDIPNALPWCFILKFIAKMCAFK